VVGDLRDLARGDQGADRDEAPVPRREAQTQPEVAEQHVGGELVEARGDGADLLPDAGRAVGLGGLVEREEFGLGRG
jgi:hypothetical protein